MKYNYLVVGSGLYGAIFAHEAKKAGKSVLVVDKRPNIAGNIYTEKQEGINVHMYGAHIFHTNNKEVWDYITQFGEFNRFTNSPVANYKGELYSMPFNMYTFNKMWGVVTPEEAAAKIEEQKKEITGEPKNLEEQAISLVGRDIYEKLVKGYTEKQWGRDCKELPAFIIKRLPVRLTFDNNYFNALYQGIPMGGYTKMIENILDGIEVRLNTDYLEHKEELDASADKVVYTGPIDAYFDYKLGTLEYRSVRFKNETLDKPNFQGNAAVNYTDRETPWTRIIEHKWFEFGKDENGNDLPKTIISREYSSEWKPGDEPYYPVNDEKNGKLYEEYKKLADIEDKVIFGGRLGEYKYYDMDTTVASVLNITNNMLFILPVTVICAILLLRTGQNTKIKGDAAIAMISVGALAIGYLLMNIFATGPNLSGDVCSTLFGSTSILTLKIEQVWLCVVLAIIVVVVFVVFYHKIFCVTFDEIFAKATGIQTDRYNLLIAVITAVIIVLAMNLVGSLLISALVIFPALSAMRIFKTFFRVTVCSAVLSVFCAVAGMLLSILAGTPVGSTIVATDIAAFFISCVIGKFSGGE